MRLLRRLTARRQRRSGRGRRPRVGAAAAAVEPGLPREGGAGGRDEPGREARDGTVGRDEAAADPAGLPDEELEYVVYDVAGAGAPLGEVVLVQQAEGLAWKWKESWEILLAHS